MTHRSGARLACIALLALTAPAAGQERADSTPPEPSSTLIPLPVLFYQPETGTAFGGAVTYYFRPGAPDPRGVPPSEIGGVGIYTSKKQIIASFTTRLYLRAGRTRVRGDAAFLKFPTTFWGIGNDAPEAAEEDFTPQTVALTGEYQRMVADGWLLGGSFAVAHRRLLEVADGGQLARGVIPGSADGRLISVGAAFTRDTRNSTTFPSRGSYHQIDVIGADGAIGSDFEYARASLDLRTYFPLGTRRVFALRAYADAATGTPPFELLPQLGGDVLLRGYYAGRFRDKLLLAVQAEFRLPVVWRIGVVGFAAAGQVGADVSDFSAEAFKTSAGGGLRFVLSREENLSIRADFGWGFDVGSGGFYLGVGEAF